MGKRVVVIASGETERRALPHLTRHLESDGASVLEVRIPPRHRAITVEMAEKLVKSVWYERIAEPPDKFVILLDVDGKNPGDVLKPFREQLAARVGANVDAALQFAYAQWHLEAWYFGDESGLRNYLGSALGSIDASAPDSIRNPKGHLRQLLRDRVYTAVTSEEIAKALNAQKIAQRSPSFNAFLHAVRNGSAIQ